MDIKELRDLFVSKHNLLLMDNALGTILTIISDAEKKAKVETILIVENRLKERHHYTSNFYKTDNYSISKVRFDEFKNEIISSNTTDSAKEDVSPAK